jgi:hypothetical protein
MISSILAPASGFSKTADTGIHTFGRLPAAASRVTEIRREGIG